MIFASAAGFIKRRFCCHIAAAATPFRRLLLPLMLPDMPMFSPPRYAARIFTRSRQHPRSARAHAMRASTLIMATAADSRPAWRHISSTSCAVHDNGASKRYRRRMIKDRQVHMMRERVRDVAPTIQVQRCRYARKARDACRKCSAQHGSRACACSRR